MRIAVPIALPLLLAGCALPFGLKWPRMPWHKPPPKAEYCVISLETGTSTGVDTSDTAAANMACKLQPSTPQ